MYQNPCTLPLTFCRRTKKSQHPEKNANEERILELCYVVSNNFFKAQTEEGSYEE